MTEITLLNCRKDENMHKLYYCQPLISLSEKQLLRTVIDRVHTNVTGSHDPDKLMTEN